MVVPVASDEERVSVHVHFRNPPTAWNFASIFGLERADVAFTGPMLRFRKSTFVGGDIRLGSRAVRGSHVVTAC